MLEQIVPQEKALRGEQSRSGLAWEQSWGSVSCAELLAAVGSSSTVTGGAGTGTARTPGLSCTPWTAVVSSSCASQSWHGGLWSWSNQTCRICDETLLWPCILLYLSVPGGCFCFASFKRQGAYMFVCAHTPVIPACSETHVDCIYALFTYTDLSVVCVPAVSLLCRC